MSRTTSDAKPASKADRHCIRHQYQVNSRPAISTVSTKLYERQNEIRLMSSTLTRTLKLSMAMVCVIATTFVLAAAQKVNIQIIPAPKQVSRSEAEFLIGRESRIVLADGRSPDDRFAAQDFVDDMKQAAAVSLRIGGSSRGEILIGLIDLPRIQQALKHGGLDPGIQKVPDEGYLLSVSRDQVVVAGKTAAGTFYGLQTLKQLVR